jgi:MFS family permease
MAIAIPSLIFILHGGVVVDRSNIKKIMMCTKAVLASAGFALAFITEFSHVEFWMLLIFGMMEGAVNAFDLPAYQALTVRLVPKEDFQQALAINSTNFHAARMLGPLLAGLLMAWRGPSLVFLFDAVTYLMLIFILSKINLRQIQRSAESLSRSRWESLVEGMKYIRHSASIYPKVSQLFLTIALIVPLMSVIFRTYVQSKFGLTAEEFGFVFTLPSLGSMLGAVSFTFIKPQRPIKALWFGIPALVTGALSVPYAPTAFTASLIMAFTGFSMYLSLASITVSLHLHVDEDYRGRLGSVIGLGFTSLGPLMGLPLGALADHFGFDPMIRAVGLVFLAGSGVLTWFNYKKPPHSFPMTSQSSPDPVISPSSEL